MNPFVFNAASNLDSELLMKMFIPDHNYSRFIESKRNVFFWGERGCGKTMTLLYNKMSLIKKAEQDIRKGNSLSFIPVYISCITPLIFKREYLLLENNFKAAVVSEHYLSLSIALSLVDSLLELPGLNNILDENLVADNISYIFDEELPSGNGVFTRLKKFITRKFIQTQKEINRSDSDAFYDDTFTFTSIITPLIETLIEQKCFSDAHFVFMMDDAHDLNSHQRAALNSWIAYRDNSAFSFKVSAAKTPDFSLATTSGGAILPGHDYIAIDIEKPFQNDHSAYGNLARKIISKRLELIDVSKSPEEFFPINQNMNADLEKARIRAKEIAIEKYGENDKKCINDYIYKYSRAIYFRERSPRANKPPYSGFETIVNVSSGVVRNLLEPCFVMYEDMISKNEGKKITEISPSVQTDVIFRLSEGFWKRLRDGINNEIDSCTTLDGQHVENLFNSLAELFRKRLLDEKSSEPRAIAFTISARTDDIMAQLTPILNIARRAQLLYVRTGNAKDNGADEDYYIPNKMLWPSRGLDPVGQHARVSIQARHLLDAALNKTPIPYKDNSQPVNLQSGLFDE
jgi:hypothetical protein